jgi:hypothetical protein
LAGAAPRVPEGFGREADRFAGTLQDLLNATVCDGVTISAYIESPTRIIVGPGLTRSSLETKPVRLAIGRARVAGWLDISYRLCMDAENQYMTVVSSFVGIYAADDLTTALCHYDYERDKTHGYPEAHLQVEAESAALNSWRLTEGGSKDLVDLHFPVGGRRYRPALEDIIEFLVVEKLAKPRPGWDAALNQSRDRFRSRQLRAAIRRDLETATEAVREFTEQ